MGAAIRSKRLFEGGKVSLMAEILRGTTPLRGAACVGREAVFDPAGRDESPQRAASRHQSAAHICAGCPVLDACSAWADQHPADGMVIAGRIPTPAHPGRPKMKENNQNATHQRTA